MSIPNLVYTYRWGWHVVGQFVEKYPRATRNFAKIVGLAVGEVRHFLTVILCKGQSTKWEAIKHVILGVNDYDDADIKRLTNKQRKLLYKYLLVLGVDDVLDEKKLPRALDSTFLKS